MTDKPWPKPSELDSFYGSPRGRNGLASATWERQDLVFVAIPWKSVAAWDKSVKINRLKVHRKVAESLSRVLNAIWFAADRKQAKIEEWGMHLIGGAYMFRPMRGSLRLSVHAYGAAVDFDPERNAMGDPTPNFANVPEVLRAFEAEGWKWGGEFSRPDAMHWEATA